MTKPSPRISVMPTDKGQKPTPPLPGLVEFLLQDFRDTAEELRVTDKKFELIFQGYGAVFTLLFSGTLSLLPTILKDMQPPAGASATNVAVTGYGLFALVLLGLLWLIALWVFGYQMQGLTLKSIYVNRLNFLRRKIYQEINGEVEQSPAFLYVHKVLPADKTPKVRSQDSFVTATQWTLVILWIAMAILAYMMFIDSLSPFARWAFVIAAFVGMFTIIDRTRKRYRRNLTESKEKILDLWKESRPIDAAYPEKAG